MKRVQYIRQAQVPYIVCFLENRICVYTAKVHYPKLQKHTWNKQQFTDLILICCSEVKLKDCQRLRKESWELLIKGFGHVLNDSKEG